MRCDSQANPTSLLSKRFGQSLGHGHRRLFFFIMFHATGREYPQIGSLAGITMQEGDGVETSDFGPTPLEELTRQESSLWALLKVLLSGKTLPHLVLIAVLAGALQWVASNDGESLASFGFLSMSGGYLLTGLLSGRSTVQRWIQLPDDGDAGELSRAKRVLFSFRICLFPLAMAGLTFGFLTVLVGEQGALGAQTSALPWLLSSCFVVWAVVQGRAFGRYIATVSAARLPVKDERVPGHLLRSAVPTLLLLFAVTTAVVAVFTLMTGQSLTLTGLMVDNAVLYAAVAGLFALAWRRSKEAMLSASVRSDFHAFSKRWMFLTQLLITWHLVTVWRHWTITPSLGVQLAEEFLLMMFTVVMAIWGLTSKSYRSPLKMVNANNALPMGLAFGYAYAGSVAMLTVVLNNVENVLMLGHIVVILTFLWLQPRTLLSSMGVAATSERIQEVVDSAVPASEPAPISHDEHEVNPEDSVSEIEPTDQPSSVEAEPAPANGSEPIGEEVAWAEPEVLASDVDWDDDIELVD